MNRFIFGHSPSATRNKFKTKDQAVAYLRRGLPQQENFRYGTTYNIHQVDSIIFSFDGELLAELVVANDETPTAQDKRYYSKTRNVYLISEIRIFSDRT